MKAWLGACALLGGGSIVVASICGLAAPTEDLSGFALAWDAASWMARPWTLWTCAWVHTSAGSLSGNLLALVAIAIVGAALRAGPGAAIALLVAWPSSTLGLLLWPEVTSYAGLGGPIHAAAMVLGTVVARHPVLKPASALLFAGMGLKLIAEHAWSQPVAFDPSWGFNVVYAAHLSGAVAGAACGWIADRLTAPG